MKIKSSVPWRNIYNMLSYYIEGINQLEIGDSSVDECKTTIDLLIELLVKALDIISLQGYNTDLIYRNVLSSRPSGKLLMQKSVSSGVYSKGMLYSHKSEFNINTRHNQIIKSVVTLIINKYEVNKETKEKLINSLERLVDVDLIDLKSYRLNTEDYISSPIYYRPALSVCRLILQDTLPSDDGSVYKLYELTDEDKLKYIFQNFVLNFYIAEYGANIVSTQTYSRKYMGYVKETRFDCILEFDKFFILIDTKWYLGKNSNRINNIRELIDYGYVNLKESSKYKENPPERWAGVVLYAEPDEIKVGMKHAETYTKDDLGIIIPFNLYCTTINMNDTFENIKIQLRNIIDKLINGESPIEAKEDIN